ncbi:dTDP-4-dehydrorhamnose 3,5-epimerase [Christensenellaceae bacterium OttesenSCG-928-M15]|nr:dTDP-4-dehydrorhamnose 3,5-epimerase [Christensenellaceae bacterium OttesenSCG-928-M15]
MQGVTVIDPFFAPDERGFFSKWFEADIFRAHGIEINPFEAFDSLSAKGVIRGLHFQKKYWQSKLVRCLSGELFDVVVDLRKGSLTFGKWEGFYLSAENRRLIFVPEGFAHGFLSLQNETITSYLCGDKFDAESDGGIRWDDPQIGVEWPLDKIDREIIVSQKDQCLPLLSELDFLR